MDLRRSTADADESELCRSLLSWLLEVDLPVLFEASQAGGLRLTPDARRSLPPSFVWEFDGERHPHALVSPLDRTLWWIDLRGPGAVLVLEFEDVDQLVAFSSQFQEIHSVTSGGRVEARWLVGERVLAHMRPEPPPYRPWNKPSLSIRGRTRAEVEQAVGQAVSLGRWVRLERIMEPASDQAGATLTPWRFRSDAPPGAVAALLDGLSPTEQLTAFVEYWFGVPLPPPSWPQECPEAFDRLHGFNREHSVFMNDMLLDHTEQSLRREVDLRGTPSVPVWSESQGLATAGFRFGDLSFDPEVVMVWDFDGKDAPTGGMTLAEFLLRQLLMEAIWQSPVTATTSIEADRVDAMVSMFDVVFPQRVWLPTLGAVGSAIARVGPVDDDVSAPSPQVEVTAAAHTREAIAGGPLAAVGGWSWGFDSNRSPFPHLRTAVIDREHQEPDIFEGFDPSNLSEQDRRVVLDRLLGVLGSTGPLDEERPPWDSDDGGSADG